MGIPGLAVPAQYGGLGQDPLTVVGALERLGYACRDNGLLFSLNAHMWTACAPVLAFGSERQKAKYLPRLCSGEWIGGNAMSEPGSGSDAYGMRTTAEKRGEFYVLNGSKTFVTNAPVADVLVVFAVTSQSKRSAGISAFLVDTSSKGSSVGRQLEKMGLRTSPMAEVFFDECEVHEENLLGREGAGASLFTHSMTWERGCILSSAIGAMQRVFDVCRTYAKSRQQFGQRIGKFQQVASKLVDMKLRIESARLIAYYGAYQRSLGRSALLESALTKLHVSECWVKNCEDAIQVHGGVGYMTEYQIERELRDAVGSRIYSGTNEIQRNLAAAMMGM
jgi:hypothetical protein